MTLRSPSKPHRRDRPEGGTVARGLRIIAMAIRLQPRPFVIAVIGSAVYGAMTVASALVFGEVTERVIEPAFLAGEVTSAALVAAAATIVGVAVAKALGIIARRIGATYMQLKLEALFRRHVTEQYQRLPLSWHRRHSTGELLSNANADVEATFWPIAPLPFAVGVAFMLVIAAWMLVVTDPYLAVVGFVVGPAIALLNWRYNAMIKVPATRSQQMRAEVSEVAHESFDGALVVKTLGRERQETERFAVESRRLRDELVKVGRMRAIFDPLVENLPNVGVLLVLLVGGWRISLGAISTGELVRIAYLFIQLAFPIRVIGFVLGELPRSVVGWERVERVLRSTGELAYGTETPRGSGSADVDLVEVSFTYGDSPVLHDVSFHAPPGRTIAIVGPTGAGKSTIASLLLRLADPQGGTIRLDGRALPGLARGVLSDQAAIVFQHSFLFDDTVRENITLGGDFTDEEVRRAARLAQADDFVRQLPEGYDTVVGEQGTSLSGGQRQRIALARALVRRPRLLILDDATSSVDTRVEQAILTGLQRADLPSTIIVVAYRQATITLADEILFVAGGEVRAHGTHEELLDREPAYARLVTAYDAPMADGRGEMR